MTRIESSLRSPRPVAHALSQLPPPPPLPQLAAPADSFSPVAAQYAVNVDSQDVGSPTTPAVKNAPGHRSRAAYDQVIDQFHVDTNPRYAIRDSSGDGYADTFCNIFAWDAISAMGVQLPHWTFADGTPAPPGYGNGGYERDANGVNDWLHQSGPKYGWKKITAEEAQRYANLGMPVVASQKSPGGIGHIGVVRPGTATNGPALAQAGAQNLNHAHVYDTFTPGVVEFYVNLEGGVPSEGPKLPIDSVTRQVPQVDLELGSTGPEVRRLQRALVRLGYLKRDDMEAHYGAFNPATQKAVKALQRHAGISPGLGRFGPLTRAALTGAIAAREPKAVAPPKGIRRGDQGENVHQLKVALYRLGYVSRAMLNAHPDQFGSGTEVAMKRFQKDHGLNPSGIYGSGSKEKLVAALRLLPKPAP